MVSFHRASKIIPNQSLNTDTVKNAALVDTGGEHDENISDRIP